MDADLARIDAKLQVMLDLALATVGVNPQAPAIADAFARRFAHTLHIAITSGESEPVVENLEVIGAKVLSEIRNQFSPPPK